MALQIVHINANVTASFPKSISAGTDKYGAINKIIINWISAYTKNIVPKTFHNFAELSKAVQILDNHCKKKQSWLTLRSSAVQHLSNFNWLCQF